MRRIVFLCGCCLAITSISAQDLTIVNARIITGTGEVIDGGSILVQDGRIVSISGSDRSAEPVGEVIDATGTTAIPGMIDTHVHLAANQNLEDLGAQVYLESGFTTILDNAGNLTLMSQLRERLSGEEVSGPRLLVSGALVGPGGHPVGTICVAQPSICGDGVMEVADSDVARAVVQAYADAGVNAIKSIYAAEPTPESRIDDAVLAAIADESEKVGLPLIVHAMRSDDARRAVDLGADRIVHAPVGPVPGDANLEVTASTLMDAGVAIATTTHIFAPIDAGDGEFLNHQSQQVPSQMVEMFDSEYLSRIRYLWDAGVTVAFGTDSIFDPAHAVSHEIQTLNRAFDTEEVLLMLTRNAAAYLNLESEIGTVEPGKLADIVLVDGNPLEDLSALGAIRVVVRSGHIVVDNR